MKRTKDLNFNTKDVLRVGICQVATKPWDIEANAQSLYEQLHKVGESGADVAVTPECVFTGYPWIESSDGAERLYKESEPINSERIQYVASICQKYNMDCVLGASTKGADPGELMNSAYYLTKEGKIAGRYDKVHCRAYEDVSAGGHFTPGSEFFTFPCQGENITSSIGVMICFDREVPEATRCLRSLGAEVILCPLACNTSKMDGNYYDYADNEIITRVRAAENEVFFVVVNHAGEVSNGGSFAVGPGGELIKQLSEEAEACIISLPILDGRVMQSKHRGQNGWGNRRSEVYDKYLSNRK